MLKHAEGPQWALVINTLLEMKSDSIVHKIGDKVFIFNNELPESSELYRVLCRRPYRYHESNVLVGLIPL